VWCVVGGDAVDHAVVDTDLPEPVTFLGIPNGWLNPRDVALLAHDLLGEPEVVGRRLGGDVDAAIVPSGDGLGGRSR